MRFDCLSKKKNVIHYNKSRDSCFHSFEKMSGLFRIFSESENSFPSNKGKEKSQISASSKLKSIGAGNTQVKPRGLSIRSNSDLNIFPQSNLNPTKEKPNSKQCIKSLEKLCLPNKLSRTPSKIKSPKNESFSNISERKLSPKILSPILQNVADEHVFKIPTIPKEFKTTKLPEPEGLSRDFDHLQFMKEEMDEIFRNDLKMVRTANRNDLVADNDSIMSSIISEDEGFLSDSDFDSSDTHFESQLPTFSDVELPDISYSDCEE